MPAGFQVGQQLRQHGVVAAKVLIRIHADDGVEVIVRERHLLRGIEAQGEDAVIQPQCGKALRVLGGGDPQIRGEDRHTELLSEQNGGNPLPAAEVQHAHAGPQGQRTRQLLGNAHRVRAHHGLAQKCAVIGVGKGCSGCHGHHCSLAIIQLGANVVQPGGVDAVRLTLHGLNQLFGFEFFEDSERTVAE